MGIFLNDLSAGSLRFRSQARPGPETHLEAAIRQEVGPGDALHLRQITQIHRLQGDVPIGWIGSEGRRVQLHRLVSPSLRAGHIPQNTAQIPQRLVARLGLAIQRFRLRLPAEPEHRISIGYPRQEGGLLLAPRRQQAVEEGFRFHIRLKESGRLG